MLIAALVVLLSAGGIWLLVGKPPASVSEQTNAHNMPALKTAENHSSGSNPSVTVGTEKNQTTKVLAPRDITAVAREAADADEIREAQAQQAKRLEVMKTKAQEYSQKRQALLQKCHDYDILGMLEEKKLECLDYLAEKRANQEVAEQQELRKKLKRKF
ncbi:MAG: hypothetical protein ACFHVJ_11340 [Aestuariibacter sp.]